MTTLNQTAAEAASTETGSTDGLRGVLHVFLRYGYRKTSLDDIAQELGVSRQTLYQRHKNKESLFKSALESEIEHILERAAKIAQRDGDVHRGVFDAMEAWFGQYVDILKSSPHAEEIISTSHFLSGEYIREAQQSFIRLLAGMIKRVRPGTKAKDTAETVFWACKGVCALCTDSSDFSKKTRTAISVILGERDTGNGAGNAR